MHLAAIDAGAGALLYWYDMNAKTKQATIRGRLVFSDSLSSDDFDISSFDMGTAAYSYGDYMTAGAFITGISFGTEKYEFFPIWTQPDFTLRFVRVTVWRVFGSQWGRVPIKQLIPKWHPGPPPVEVTRSRRGSEVRLQEDEIEAEEPK